jgi:hypothetical protein
MKKKNFNSKLKLNSAKVASFNQNSILGGYKDDTVRDCNTRYFKCSNIVCYTDVTCLHTDDGCHEPIGLSAGCISVPATAC